MAWRKPVTLRGGVECPNAVWIGVNLVVITNVSPPYAMLAAMAFPTDAVAREHMQSILGVPGKTAKEPIDIREFRIDGVLLGQFMTTAIPGASAYKVISGLIHDAIMTTKDVPDGMTDDEPPVPKFKNFFAGCEVFAL